jgi:hypothetical protein
LFRSSTVRRLPAAGALALATLAVGVTSADAALTVSASQQVMPPGNTDPGGYVYAYDDAAPTSIEVRRGETVVKSGAFSVSGFALQAGDVIRVLRNGAEAASLTYDGYPSFDAGTCAGQTAFTGKRTGTANVSEVYAYKWEPFRYRGFDTYRTTGEIVGDITGLAGDAFSGAFRAALPAGHILTATQTQRPADGVTFYTTVERPVADCPQQTTEPSQQPQLPTVTPDTVKPKGKLILPSGKVLTLKNLFDADGMTTTVELDEPGTVVQALYLRNGAKVPQVVTANAAQKKKKKKKAKRVLIAKGQASSQTAGQVKVRLKATKKARKAYKRKRKVKAVLVTTVADLAGNVTSLPQRKLTLRK